MHSRLLLSTLYAVGAVHSHSRKSTSKIQRVWVTCSKRGKVSSLSPAPAPAQSLCPQPPLPEARLTLPAFAGVRLRVTDSAVKVADRVSVRPSLPAGFRAQRRSETAHRGASALLTDVAAKPPLLTKHGLLGFCPPRT